MFSSRVMKLAANPTKPYIRHRAQTFLDQTKCFQESRGRGPGLFASSGRPDVMRASSAALTAGISDGRLRNHGQNAQHQRRPSAACSQQGVAQSLAKTRVISQTTRTGARAPPNRLNAQIVPWAEARRDAGTQSATTRASPGKPPLCNAAKRNCK